MQLATAGLRVVCIEPEDAVRQAVGESLDWSAPELLNALGLPMEDLVKGGFATWKRHVTVKLRDGASAHYEPGSWLAEAPFGVELRTMHVDRLRLDEELLKRTVASGVIVVRDTVVKVERDGDRVVAIHTAGGARFSSPWFIDASGFATSLLPREFDLPAIQFGPPKVAIWMYSATSELVEGTTLYMEPLPAEYLDWVWEIPIGPQEVSVGYVTTGAAMKAWREQGLGVEDIFVQQLRKYPRFEALLQGGPLGPSNVTAFRSRVYDGVAGPNWFVAGGGAAPGGSHHGERSDRGVAACRGSFGADSEIPRAGQAAAAGANCVQSPDSANGEILQQWNRENSVRTHSEESHWRASIRHGVHHSGMEHECGVRAAEAERNSEDVRAGICAGLLAGLRVDFFRILPADAGARMRGYSGVHLGWLVNIPLT